MTTVTAAPPAASFPAVLLGAKMALSRLRHRRTWMGLFLALAVTVAGAWIELSAASMGAVDRALAALFRIVVPLLALMVVGRAGGREGVGAGAHSLARFGAPRFAVAIGAAASAAAAAGAAAAALAALTVVLAHSNAAPPLARDLIVSSAIGVSAGVCYGAWIAFGSTFWKGRGRWMVVGADFLLGGSAGFVGSLFPRSHVMSLLGAASGPMGMAPRFSFAALWILTGVLFAATAARSGK
ncbi:MAG: hypothetical protein IPK82_39375 [Polyangiaceae bacterium]|nr:hypothetical protein [Polyangiaceae bacterium]